MGFPYENGSWEGVSGVIFVGGAGGSTGFYSLVAIGLCIAALVLGNRTEASKYKDHQ